MSAARLIAFQGEIESDVTTVHRAPGLPLPQKACTPMKTNRLMENTGRVISREQLNQTLYGWGENIDSNALEVHIHNLRKRFGTKLIRTIRGVGYMVKAIESNKE